MENLFVKDIFEEPSIDCVHLSNELYGDDNRVPGGDLGEASNIFPDIP